MQPANLRMTCAAVFGSYMRRKKKLIAEGKYKKGLRDGIWRGYYTNGELFYTGRYKLGRYHGEWRYFFKGGEFLQAGKYERGMRVGVWKICVYRQGPCAREYYNRPTAPAIGKRDLRKSKPRQTHKFKKF